MDVVIKRASVQNGNVSAVLVEAQSIFRMIIAPSLITTIRATATRNGRTRFVGWETGREGGTWGGEGVGGCLCW